MPREAKNKRVTHHDPGHANELTFSVYRRKKRMLEEGIAEFFLQNLRCPATPRGARLTPEPKVLTIRVLRDPG